MQRFLIRRFLSAILSLVGATFFVFVIAQASQDPLLLYAKPGGYGISRDQEAALRKKLGLDKPVFVQYALWLGRATKGDLGNSIFDELPVTKKLGPRFKPTLQVGVTAWLFATFVGVPLGVLSAVKRASWWDYFGRTFALFGQAIPNFWLGIMMILVISVRLNWLPPSGLGSGDSIFPWKYLIMPVIVLGTATAAGYLRITRSAMLEVLDSEFIKLARAKGVSYNWVIWKHALRNALIPPLTVSAVLMASFITGSLITETVFAIPGLGRLAVESVQNNDFPLLAGITLIFTAVWVTVNFLSDVLYVVIDPRIRLS